MLLEPATKSHQNLLPGPWRLVAASVPGGRVFEPPLAIVGPYRAGTPRLAGNRGHVKSVAGTQQFHTVKALLEDLAETSGLL